MPKETMWHAKVLEKQKRLLRGKGFQAGDELYRESVDSAYHEVDPAEERNRKKEKLRLEMGGIKNSVDYAAWLKFIREQGRRKKKLPNGANYKWIAWQQKQKEIQSRAPVMGRSLSQKELLALKQAKQMRKQTSNMPPGSPAVEARNDKKAVIEEMEPIPDATVAARKDTPVENTRHAVVNVEAQEQVDSVLNAQIEISEEEKMPTRAEEEKIPTRAEERKLATHAKEENIPTSVEQEKIQTEIEDEEPIEVNLEPETKTNRHSP